MQNWTFTRNICKKNKWFVYIRNCPIFLWSTNLQSHAIHRLFYLSSAILRRSWLVV